MDDRELSKKTIKAAAVWAPIDQLNKSINEPINRINK